MKQEAQRQAVLGLLVDSLCLFAVPSLAHKLFPQVQDACCSSGLHSCIPGRKKARERLEAAFCQLILTHLNEEKELLRSFSAVGFP